MHSKTSFQFSYDVIFFPILLVISIWVVFWMETRLGVRLTKWGIYPLEVSGLKGILVGPFVHGSLKHLFNNSIPLLVLTAALFYFYRNIRWQVFLYGWILTGLLTWFIARPAWHIGASGIVYLLASFLFFKGVFSKQFQLVALSLIVVFLYGSLLWYLFPIDPKISWEGHASGFAVGFFFSLIFRKNPIEQTKFEWEKDTYKEADDPFLQHFDEDGNFIESLPEEPSDEKIPQDSIKIHYHFRTTEEE
ncbi:MAG: rhomboid family intramembrane serine protease [Flavobacteriaceae bacterium]|nr:rhomboid family intramembrane serine protease [Flavobacteriaceae bacterium]